MQIYTGRYIIRNTGNACDEFRIIEARKKRLGPARIGQILMRMLRLYWVDFRHAIKERYVFDLEYIGEEGT